MDGFDPRRAHFIPYKNAVGTPYWAVLQSGMASNEPPRNRFLIICGLSFAGKTTLGKAICERLGFIEVDVDETKVTLFGQDIRDEDILPDQWVAIYHETDLQIEKILKSGMSVLDASRYFQKAERDAAKNMAYRVGVPFVLIYVDTPLEIARQRLLENRRTFLRRDVSNTNFEDILRAMQPPEVDEYPLVFHYLDDIDHWLNVNLSKITST
jgi:predicted kinase